MIAFILIIIFLSGLIFYLYSSRISLNLDEIDEQLKLSHDKKEFEEFLISEMIVKTVEKDKLESYISEIKNKIESEGFKNIAMKLSISQSAANGGDLGWLSENKISKKFKNIIVNTPVGSISKAILLKDGILFFKVRNKRKVEQKIDLEELKNELVNAEKTKILNMYSRSHYENSRRTTPVKFF